MNDQSPMLTGCISKISTQTAGGYKIVIDAPEIMALIVRQLLGSENKTVYQVSFQDIGSIEGKPNRGPGRPAREPGE